LTFVFFEIIRCILGWWGASYDSVGSDEAYQFFESLAEGLFKSRRRLRYARLKAFCNFLIEKCNLNMRNPCNALFFREP
jgi:hypothetical protein